MKSQLQIYHLSPAKTCSNNKNPDTMTLRKKVIGSNLLLIQTSNMKNQNILQMVDKIYFGVHRFKNSETQWVQLGSNWDQILTTIHFNIDLKWRHLLILQKKTNAQIQLTEDTVESSWTFNGSSAQRTISALNQWLKVFHSHGLKWCMQHTAINTLMGIRD